MAVPLDNRDGQEIIFSIRYTVIKAEPSLSIQFASFNSETEEITGKVISMDGTSVAGLPIYGASEESYGTYSTDIISIHPFSRERVYTDNEGAFTIPYEENLAFAVLDNKTGAYSMVQKLKEGGFIEEEVADSTTAAESTVTTESEPQKEAEQKKTFPFTGEAVSTILSFLGMGAILLAIVFFYVRSKKQK